ncbi:MAG: light-harvesting protein [Pseudomonadota bacterium]
MASDLTSGSSSSGLTAAEAQAFHKLFIAGFLGFTAFAAIVHFILYQGKPWGPGVGDNAALESAIQFAGSVPGLIG